MITFNFMACVMILVFAWIVADMLIMHKNDFAADLYVGILTLTASVSCHLIGKYV